MADVAYGRIALVAVAWLLPWLTGVSERFRYDSQVGLAESQSGGKLCLQIENVNLRGGDRVDLVMPDTPQSHLRARIREKVAKSCSSNKPDSASDSYYLMSLSEKGDAPLSISFAIVGFAGKISDRDGAVYADLDDDGTPDSFRSCASHEGLHLTVWNGKPLSGVRRWHRYYYLGYDVEPSCTDSDY